MDAVSRMVDSGMTPADLVGVVFGGLAFDVLDEAQIDYVCNCSRERFGAALVSLGQQELEKLIEEGEPVETCCSFCGKKYVFDLDTVRQMKENARP